MRVFIACVLLSVAALIDSGKSMLLANDLAVYCMVWIDTTCDNRHKDFKSHFFFCNITSRVTLRCFEKIRQSPALRRLKLRFIVSVCANQPMLRIHCEFVCCTTVCAQHKTTTVGRRYLNIKVQTSSCVARYGCLTIAQSAALFRRTVTVSWEAFLTKSCVTLTNYDL